MAVVPAQAGQQAHGAVCAAGHGQLQAASPVAHAGSQVAQQRLFFVEHPHILRQCQLHPQTSFVTTLMLLDCHRQLQAAAAVAHAGNQVAQ